MFSCHWWKCPVSRWPFICEIVLQNYVSCFLKDTRGLCSVCTIVRCVPAPQDVYLLELPVLSGRLTSLTCRLFPLGLHSANSVQVLQSSANMFPFVATLFPLYCWVSFPFDRQEKVSKPCFINPFLCWHSQTTSFFWTAQWKWSEENRYLETAVCPQLFVVLLTWPKDAVCLGCLDWPGEALRIKMLSWEAWNGGAPLILVLGR